MTQKSYYETLGVSTNADYKEIKRAYRQLAKKMHPDKTLSATENDRLNFAKVAEAFNESNDPWQSLKSEGEPGAKTIREQLDNVSPGLGNPVVSVKVDVEEAQSEVNQLLNQESLMQCLERIECNIKEIESLLEDPRDNSSS